MKSEETADDEHEYEYEHEYDEHRELRVAERPLARRHRLAAVGTTASGAPTGR
jgi:hypothetical protein